LLDWKSLGKYYADARKMAQERAFAPKKDSKTSN